MKLGISIFLWVLASVVSPIINLLGIFGAIINISLSKRFDGKRKKVFADFFGGNALSKDQHGNAANWHLFNVLMLKRSKRKILEEQYGKFIVEGVVVSFGNPDQTPSYVFGKNRNIGALNIHGRFWAFFLNTVDEGHTDNAVIKEEKQCQ